MQDLDADGARALLAAVIWRAVEDASKGYPAARDWLVGAGAELADDLGICEPYVVRAWAACHGPLPNYQAFRKKARRAGVSSALEEGGNHEKRGCNQSPTR